MNEITVYGWYSALSSKNWSRRKVKKGKKKIHVNICTSEMDGTNTVLVVLVECKSVIIIFTHEYKGSLWQRPRYRIWYISDFTNKCNRRSASCFSVIFNYSYLFMKVIYTILFNPSYIPNRFAKGLISSFAHRSTLNESRDPTKFLLAKFLSWVFSNDRLWWVSVYLLTPLVLNS